MTDHSNTNDSERRETMELAEKVREACIQAAREGFQEASMSGLCVEGASEAAVGAIQMLNLEQIIDGQS